MTWPPGYPLPPNPDSRGENLPSKEGVRGRGALPSPGSRSPGLGGAAQTPGQLAGQVSEKEGTVVTPAPEVGGGGGLCTRPHPR